MEIISIVVKRKIILVLSILVLLCSCAGKDTVSMFSDDDVQIVKFHDDARKRQHTNALYIPSKAETVDLDVQGYLEKDGILYVVGENGYTVLDLSTKQYIQNTDISVFSDSEQAILRDLEVD